MHIVFKQDDKFVLKKSLQKDLAELFSTAKPFLDYVNRAIDFYREYP